MTKQIGLVLCLTGLLAAPALGEDVIEVPEQYEHIQEAIDIAADGDIISVWGEEGQIPPYIYPENIDFLGKGVTVVSRRFIENHPGIAPSWDSVHIRGVLTTAPVVLMNVPQGKEATLRGFTIENGLNQHGSGGGVSITCDNGTVTVDYCRIRDCDAPEGNGGGIYASVTGASLIITNDSVANNLAYGQGGGIAVQANGSSSGSVLSDNYVESNELAGGVDAQGGGIYALDWPCPFRRNVVRSNQQDGVWVSTGPQVSELPDLGTYADPGRNVLMANQGSFDLVAQSMNTISCDAVGNYWGTLNTHTILERIELMGMGIELYYDPVAASGRWFDIEGDQNSVNNVQVTGDLVIAGNSALDLSRQWGQYLWFSPDPDFNRTGGDERCELFVDPTAVLITRGAGTNFTFFHCADPAGAWAGIRAVDASLILRTCNLAYADCAIDFIVTDNPLTEPNLLVSDITEFNFNNTCLRVQGSYPEPCMISVRDARFVENDAFGILCEGAGTGGAVTVSSCYFTRTRVAHICLRDCDNTHFAVQGNTMVADPGPLGDAPNGIEVVDLGADASLLVGGPDPEDQNVITGFQWAGIRMQGISSAVCDLEGNLISGIENDGLACFNTVSGSPRVRSCKFEDMKTGVYAYEGALPDLGVYDPYDPDPGLNSFSAEDISYFVYNSGPVPLLAQLNWWGSDPPDFSKFIGPVVFDPWLHDPPEGGAQSVGHGAGSTADAGFSIAPNPFALTTRLYCQVPRQNEVSLRVFDITGRVVRDIHHGPMAQGEHVLSWDGADNSGKRVSAGVYLCVFESGDFRQTQRLVLTD